MTRRALEPALVACVVATLGSIGRAGQSPVTAPPGSSRVSVDFRVTSRGGEPIADLRPTELRLIAGGRERRVESLDLITPGRRTDERSDPRSESPLPPPFAVSSDAGSLAIRHFLIAVDEAAVHFGREQPLRDFVASLLASISPQDLVGVMSFGAREAHIAFTNTHDTIRAAVNAVVGGHQPTSTCHRRVVSQMLQSAVAAVPQGLSSTVFFIAGPTLGTQLPTTIGTLRQPQVAQSCALLPAEVAALGRAIARSQAQVYVQGLNDLADTIGADAVVLSGAQTARLEGLLRETGAFYRATFKSENERPDDVHRLELRVDRPNVRVRAPSHISFPLAGARETVHPSSPAGLRLRALAVPARHSPERIKLLTIFEAVEPAATLREAIVAVLDERGQTAAQATLRPADLSRRPVVSAVIVPPGVYRVRIFAADALGRRGTVEDAVRAELAAAGPISTSGLLFGTIAEGAFAPRLEFGSEPRATPYLELYGGGPGDRVTVVFELAESLDGPAIVRIPGVIRSEANGPRVGTADIPLPSLPSGDVLVRAIINVNGAPAARVLRTLRKTGS